jgi:hypothetical protein
MVSLRNTVFTDMELLAMPNVFANYMKTRMERLLDITVKGKQVMQHLRQYLYKKYAYQPDTATSLQKSGWPAPDPINQVHRRMVRNQEP